MKTWQELMCVVDNLKLHHVVDFPGFDTRVIVISFMPEFVFSLGSPSHDYAFLLPFYSKVERRPHVLRVGDVNAPGAHDALTRLLECYFADAKKPFFQAGAKAFLLELLYSLAAHFRASEVLKWEFVSLVLAAAGGGRPASGQGCRARQDSRRRPGHAQLRAEGNHPCDGARLAHRRRRRAHHHVSSAGWQWFFNVVSERRIDVERNAGFVGIHLDFVARSAEPIATPPDEPINLQTVGLAPGFFLQLLIWSRAAGARGSGKRSGQSPVPSVALR